MLFDYFYLKSVYNMIDINISDRPFKGDVKVLNIRTHSGVLPVGFLGGEPAC